VAERLWAPWRLEYIEQADKSGGCIFCDKPIEKDDAGNLLVFRGETAFVMLNAFPYSHGHLMVAPYRHSAELDELTDAEMLEMFRLLRECRKWLISAYSPQGFNIGANLGRAAGAGIEGHIHIHVVPRWSGDTNFMPLLADVRVMPEALQKTYERLSEEAHK
jgi:ATP adenylyltransferase